MASRIYELEKQRTEQIRQMRKLKEENAMLRKTSTAAGDFEALGKRGKGAGTYTKETADKHSRSLWRINLALCGGSEEALRSEMQRRSTAHKAR